MAGSSRSASQLGEVGDLHRRGIGDVDALDLRRERRLVEARSAALGTGGERDRAIDERADVRLHRVAVLREEALLHAFGTRPS